MTSYIWVGDTTDIVLTIILALLIISFIVFIIVEPK